MNAVITSYFKYLSCESTLSIYRKHVYSLSLTTCNTFENIDMAKRAKSTLDGADIYSGCCTLKIEFAKVYNVLSTLFINILYMYRYYYVYSMPAEY